MEYILTDGKKIIIREPKCEDAANLIHMIQQADTETLFLARNPGELQISVEDEERMISQLDHNNEQAWFVAQYDNTIIGMCSVGLVRNSERYRHRADVAFLVLQKYCSLGIGSKLMQECIQWCQEHAVTQMELEVVQNNQRALHMYQRFGFEITGTIPNALRYLDGTYANEYMMVKQL